MTGRIPGRAWCLTENQPAVVTCYRAGHFVQACAPTPGRELDVLRMKLDELIRRADEDWRSDVRELDVLRMKLDELIRRADEDWRSDVSWPGVHAIISQLREILK